MLDTARHIRTTIYQIAQEDQLVCRHISGEQIDERLKLSAAAMNIADDKSFHD